MWLKIHIERLCAPDSTLADLADLRVLPVGKDIADIEGALCQEPDDIEYQLGQDLCNRA